jgi:hypothetical protein
MRPDSTNPEGFEVVDGGKFFGSTTPTPFVIQEAFALLRKFWKSLCF